MAQPARYRLGNAALAAGDRDEARTQLQKALELDPKADDAEDAKKTLEQLKEG